MLIMMVSSSTLTNVFNNLAGSQFLQYQMYSVK